MRKEERAWTSEHASIKKAQTGIQGLDEITEGGQPAGRPTLVAGGAGAGKTMLATEFLVRVTDTGCGISTEFLPHVFDRFSQTDNSNTRRKGGLGLGLALVRHLAELHGGTVEASSGGLGCGSTFVVRLPAVGHFARLRVS